MTITDPILDMTPDDRVAEHQRRLDEARTWLSEEPPLPTAAEVVAPIIAELLRLHDLRERVEAHIDALDSYEFTDVTDDDWRAARELLALHHEIADLLSLELSGWSTRRQAAPPRRSNSGGPLRGDGHRRTRLRLPGTRRSTHSE